MRKKKMKKAYIFLLDSIFAVILLVIGLIIISSNRTQPSSESHLASALDDSLDLLSSVKVSDICDRCNCSIKRISELCLAGKVKNSRESLLDYAGELYSSKDIASATAFLENISREKDIFREKELFDVEIKINNERIYPSINIDTSVSKKRAQNLLSGRRIIFGYYEDQETGYVNYWGPYEVEAQVWEKQ